MARKNPPAKWVLPAVVDPPERLCVQIMIPKERMHIAAFRGALLNLAAAYKWSDDAGHTAKDVALIWRDVISKITVCNQTSVDCCPQEDEFMVQRQEGCLLQQQCADGSWMTIYDPTACIKELIGAGAGQAPPAGEIEGGAEVTVCDIILPANGRYIFPYAVKPGDTITISQARGGWFGDGATQHWWCVDGYAGYVVGACLDPWYPPELNPASPIPTLPVMRLIAMYGSAAIDMLSGPVVLPTSYSQSDLVFQANDANLGDNAGSVTFCVTVSHPIPGETDFSGMDWVIALDVENVDYSALIEVLQDNGNPPKGYVVGTGLSCGESGDNITFRFSLNIVAGHSEVRAMVVDVWNTYETTIPPDGLSAAGNDNIHSTAYRVAEKYFSAATWTKLRVDVDAGDVEVNPGWDTILTYQCLGSGSPAPATDGNTIVRKVWVAGMGTPPGAVHS